MRNHRQFTLKRIRIQFEEVLNDTRISNSHNHITNLIKTPIYDYTGEGYELINDGLRKKKKVKNEYFINYGLKKMKSFNGLTYRSATLNQSIIDSYFESYKKDKIISDLAFFSTSLNFRIATGSFGGNVIFKIFSKRGKQIMKLSMHPYEEEVLFSSKTKFKISNIIKDIRLDLYNIDLVEV